MISLTANILLLLFLSHFLVFVGLLVFKTPPFTVVSVELGRGKVILLFSPPSLSGSFPHSFLQA